MKRPFLFGLTICLVVPGWAGRKREKEADPRLRAIHTVFVKGNSEAAVKARGDLEKWTCFNLAANPTKADAVLEIDQQMSRNDSFLKNNSERAIVSASLTTKDGDLLWSDTSSSDAGIVHTGAGMSVADILFKLQKSAFPEMLKKAGMHGVHRDACPPADTGSQ